MSVELINVSATYPGQKNPAVRGIDLETGPGEFVYMVGPSGSGKSTLINVMIGQLKADKGSTVNVVGYDLTELPNRYIWKLRRQLGIVYQDYKLLENKTVFENAAITLELTGMSKDKIQNLVNETLEMVGLLQYKNRKPDQLSGGEGQRLAIARAVVGRPKLLLADEPTGNLDPVNAEGILHLLEDINGLGTTIIMATHDATLVDNFPHRVVEINKGFLTRDDVAGAYTS